MTTILAQKRKEKKISNKIKPSTFWYGERIITLIETQIEESNTLL